MSEAGRDWLARSRVRVDEALETLLPDPAEPPALLHEAMRYAVLGGGKRLRPALVYASARACGADEARATPVAAAVELVHAYSLVHDDLPAMDDDHERRGRPTVHVKFGEDLAILTGDALLALAFGALGQGGARGALVARLAEAAGSRELVGGQVDDLRCERSALTPQSVASIHRRKTGALFRFSAAGAAEFVGAPAELCARLERFAADYAAAFQIADDLQDGERSETSVLRVLEPEAARRLGQERLDAALTTLGPLGAAAAPLAALAQLVSERLETL